MFSHQCSLKSFGMYRHFRLQFSPLYPILGIRARHVRMGARANGKLSANRRRLTQFYRSQWRTFRVRPYGMEIDVNAMRLRFNLHTLCAEWHAKWFTNCQRHFSLHTDWLTVWLVNDGDLLLYAWTRARTSADFVAVTLNAINFISIPLEAPTTNAKPSVARIPLVCAVNNQCKWSMLNARTKCIKSHPD